MVGFGNCIKLVCALAVFLGAFTTSAMDYTWLSNPVNGDWLGAVNWSSGEWAVGTDDTATFGASSQTTVNVNGTIPLASLAVNGVDYTFTNGTLQVEGAFNVADGNTAMVESYVLQASETTRFSKTGTGTLVMKGDAAHTNKFHRFALHKGTTILDGGEYHLTGSTTSPSESATILSLAGASKLFLTGGANFVLDTKSTSYAANSGCDVVVSNATFDCWNLDEFLHGFQDHNQDEPRSTFTIADGGVVVAKKIRLGKLVSPRRRRTTTPAPI